LRVDFGQISFAELLESLFWFVHQDGIAAPEGVGDGIRGRSGESLGSLCRRLRLRLYGRLPCCALKACFLRLEGSGRLGSQTGCKTLSA
jgi:hypothetical protein